jgi:DNA repair protein RadD
MAFQLRSYQSESVAAGVSYLTGKVNKGAIIILPTGSGKSIVIANLIAPLQGKTIILQPSKEILEQNFAKYVSYGYPASVYSASVGEKRIGKVTFATIGSIIKKKELFRDVQNILIDECHLVNPKGGMYEEFISSLPDAKVLGLTATPYRLYNNSFGAELRFITRTRPNIFKSVLYYVQNKVLFDSGYLAKLEYFAFDVVNREMLKLNSTGTDYDQRSLKEYYKKIDMPRIIVEYAHRLLKKKPNLLIFCAMTDEAKIVVANVPGSVLLTSETKKDERERILSKFKKGIIKCVVNVGVLTTGFDYPELECVLLARSTMSLALYYQIVGRAMRIAPSKQTAWIVDLGGNVKFFGKIETMEIKTDEKNRFAVWNNGRQLTNVPFQK